MKLSTAHLLPVLSLPAFTLAHVNYPRQSFASSSSAASTTTSSISSISSDTLSVSSTKASTTTALLPSFTLKSQNPTAVPLSSIVANVTSAAFSPLPTAVPPGTKPAAIPNAPGIPDISGLSPNKYPAMDKPPPTDSPEVQQWIKEVMNSGVSIPSFDPTATGGCSANPAAVSDSTRCWWTCGGCTRSTDITTCPQKYTWGLTYDDGPSRYTPDLLNYLSQVNLSTTFFVVGSRALQFSTILQEEYMLGHQIAVHTWSHPSLTTLTNEEIIAELGWTKKIIKDVTGVEPLMMRPPYGDIDDRVRAICEAMNLAPVMWTRISSTATFDTDDFDIHGGLTSVQRVLNNWENILNNVSTINTGFIVLEHDLFQQTVEVATGYILPDALAHQPQFTIQPVVSCLGLSLADAYLQTNDNSTHPLAVNRVSLLSQCRTFHPYVLTFAAGATATNSSSPGSSGQSGKNGAGVGPVASTSSLVAAAFTAVLGAMAFTL
ncbi:hypothetical protein BJV78DRAFT_1116658 [Lactifluus subvellereus]|nr:hypothetical protein BJV78DRAFT_1116658 [Lactifluus subvellereus]